MTQKQNRFNSFLARKNIRRAFYGLVGVVLVGGGYGLSQAVKPSPSGSSDRIASAPPRNDSALQSQFLGNIHWHARVNMEICGVPRDLPTSPNGFVGKMPGIHSHNDDVFHIEGVVRESDITLGKAFDAHRIPFDSDKIFDKKNGNKCGDKEGKLTVSVNGNVIESPRDYVMKDGDKIEVRFE